MDALLRPLRQQRNPLPQTPPLLSLGVVDKKDRFEPQLPFVKQIGLQISQIIIRDGLQPPNSTPFVQLTQNTASQENDGNSC